MSDEKDITDRFVDVAKEHPSLHFVLKDGYDEIKKLRGRIRGLEMEIDRRKAKDAKAFKQAINDAVRNADHDALLAAVETEIDMRTGDY